MGDSFDFSDLEKSCVQLCTELVGGSYGFGTGNIIYKDAFHKLILTCGHNVAVYFTPNTIVNFTVKTDESSWEPAYLITTEKYAKEELALLRTGVNVGKVSSEEVDVGGSSGEKLATRFEVWEGVLKLSEPTMCKGMDVHMSSFMSGGIVSNNSGTISQLVIPGDIFGGEIPEFVSYNIMSGLGSSGAAVVDKLGQLVAVHVSADMVDVSYDPSYQNSLAAYKLQTASGMKYGIPYFRVQRMINFFCNSLPSDILEDKLRYLATTMVPNPLNHSPPKLKEKESSVETKLRKEQLWFGSYVCQPVIAGLGDGNKPFICTVDSIGAKELAKDFVVAGTASESLYGACESMHKPEMEPEELFETISQALQASVDRDCLSGWGAPVCLVELPKDFIVAGTASESLYGASESMYKPEMEPEELIETISRALQASVDRDCLSDWGTHVYLVFGPYFCQPVIAGLGDGNKPFICTMDSIDARELAKDFVVAGTAFESLYGACESMYKAEMEPEELFETISQALQASVDRDCLSGCGAHVYLVELAKDFVVAGTASESLYGACESLYKPEMTQPIETKEVFSKTH